MLLDGGVLFGFRLFAEAAVRAALPAQKVGISAEQLAALGLDVRADGTAHVGALVVVETAFCKRLVDDVNRALHEPALVGVLDAQDEFAPGVAGDEPGI